MHTKGMLLLFCALSIELIACSDDDSNSGGGADAGDETPTGGGRAGSGGTGGRAGSGSAGSGTGSGTSGSGSDGGAGSGAGAGSSSDAGPNETPDAGVTDAGTTDGGTTDGGVATVPGCAGLMLCCDGLSTPERMGCELLASNADDAMCDQLQLVYCEQQPGSGDPGACMDLNACCETLARGAVRVACATTVMNDVAFDCEQLEMALCPEGGDPNACEDLAPCCEMLPPPQAASCNALVDQGLAAACEAVVPTLCN